jgi:uncharacterized membrane protein YtjA (UPF0391 family)
MKKLSISLVVALAAFSGVAGATAASAGGVVPTAMPCCKGIH